MDTWDATLAVAADCHAELLALQATLLSGAAFEPPRTSQATWAHAGAPPRARCREI
jgi:hypothetical protein